MQRTVCGAGIGREGVEDLQPVAPWPAKLRWGGGGRPRGAACMFGSGQPEAAADWRAETHPQGTPGLLGVHGSGPEVKPGTVQQGGQDMAGGGESKGGLGAQSAPQ